MADRVSTDSAPLLLVKRGNNRDCVVFILLCYFINYHRIVKLVVFWVLLTVVSNETKMTALIWYAVI